MKRICIVAPSLKIGGIGRVSSELANFWANNGYEVVFISCLAGNRLYQLNEKVRLIEPDYKRKTSSVINKSLFYPRILSFIRKNVQLAQPDVVLSFGDAFNPLALLALRFTNYPVYISDRTSPDYQYGFINTLLKRKLYPLASGFIAQTQRMKEYRQKQYPDLRIEVIPNPMRQLPAGNHEKKNVILYVGRFAAEKGPDRLIEAFSKLKHAAGWELRMAGDGPMLPAMKALAKDLGVAERVNFLGKVNNVEDHYRKASIFVLPSRLEGFPNALCEAMSSGLPCITFDTIPYQEIFTVNKSGKVVFNNDIDGLASCLQELILQPEARAVLGGNAIEEMKRFSIANVAKRFADFMQI